MEADEALLIDTGLRVHHEAIMQLHDTLPDGARLSIMAPRGPTSESREPAGSPEQGRIGKIPDRLLNSRDQVQLGDTTLGILSPRYGC